MLILLSLVKLSLVKSYAVILVDNELQLDLQKTQNSNLIY